jgi:hypothetical protein
VVRESIAELVDLDSANHSEIDAHAEACGSEEQGEDDGLGRGSAGYPCSGA